MNKNKASTYEEAKHMRVNTNNRYHVAKKLIWQHKFRKLIDYYSVYRKVKRRTSEAKYPYLKSSK